MKYLPFFFITILLTSCSLKSKMEIHEKTQKEADFIIENFTDYNVIKDKLPEKYFQPTQAKEYISNFAQKCNWSNRKGKFVDYCTMKNIGGTDQTAFIYEYLLNCDSLRVILIYNITEKSSELFKIDLEQIEKENKMIIDPSKQLLAK